MQEHQRGRGQRPLCESHLGFQAGYAVLPGLSRGLGQIEGRHLGTHQRAIARVIRQHGNAVVISRAIEPPLEHAEGFSVGPASP